MESITNVIDVGNRAPSPEAFEEAANSTGICIDIGDTRKRNR